MSNTFPYQQVIVTGGRGFVGHHVVNLLKQRGVEPYIVGRFNYDLRDELNAVRMVANHAPDLIIHLAATCGGIGANQAAPADFARDNLLMGVNVIDAAHSAGVPKLVIAGTICAYPKHCPVPFSESEFWNGYPEETNAPYGLAKKMLIVMSGAYRQQYGFNSVNPLIANLYGPRDHFDLEKSHVIPALIRKCIEAVETGADSIQLWGTGKATREFLFVEDAAEAILAVAEHYNSSDPVNIGTGNEISIADLTALIAELVGFTGTLNYDSSKPDGQPRRALDTSRAKTAFGWQAKTKLVDGLRKTIDWYRSNRNI